MNVISVKSLEVAGIETGCLRYEANSGAGT
jgi:hypothetical protein